jgi:hypothetical protein
MQCFCIMKADIVASLDWHLAKSLPSVCNTYFATIVQDSNPGSISLI